ELFFRLHNIHGESNFNARVIAFRFAAMSIILRACELGEDFEDLRLEDPVREAHHINWDTTLQHQVRLANGRRMTALQVQFEQLELSVDKAKAAGYLTEQEQRYGELMLRGLVQLQEDPRGSEIFGYPDWVVKQRLIDSYLASDTRKKLDESDHDAAWKAAGAYHRIYPSEGRGMKLVRAGAFPDSPSDDILDKGQPLPKETKGRVRAEGIRRGEEQGVTLTANWDKLEIDETAACLNLRDPYEADYARLDRYLPDAA